MKTALHGVLARVRDLGAALTSVTTGGGARRSRAARRARRRTLVSCAVDSVKKSSESFEDVLCGLGPYERPGVVVPGFHPSSDVGFEGLDAAVVAAVEQVLGEVGEPAFHLVEPAGVGRGVVQGEAGVP